MGEERASFRDAKAGEGGVYPNAGDGGLDWAREWCFGGVEGREESQRTIGLDVGGLLDENSR
jgi:hypothetical protein